MRICMLISRYPPDRGGMEIQCQSLSRALAARGNAVTVLTERSQSDNRDTQEAGVRVIRYRPWGSPPWSSFLSGLRMFFYLLKDRAFDIYHAHMLATPALVALWIRKILKNPFLVKHT